MTFYDIRDYLNGNVTIKSCNPTGENIEIVFDGESDDIPDFFDDVDVDSIEAYRSAVLIYVDFDSYNECRELE